MREQQCDAGHTVCTRAPQSLQAIPPQHAAQHSTAGTQLTPPLHSLAARASGGLFRPNAAAGL